MKKTTNKAKTKDRQSKKDFLKSSATFSIFVNKA